MELPPSLIPFYLKQQSPTFLALWVDSRGRGWFPTHACCLCKQSFLRSHASLPLAQLSSQWAVALYRTTDGAWGTPDLKESSSPFASEQFLLLSKEAPDVLSPCISLYNILPKAIADLKKENRFVVENISIDPEILRTDIIHRPLPL